MEAKAQWLRCRALRCVERFGGDSLPKRMFPGPVSDGATERLSRVVLEEDLTGGVEYGNWVSNRSEC